MKEYHAMLRVVMGISQVLHCKLSALKI